MRLHARLNPCLITSNTLGTVGNFLPGLLFENKPHSRGPVYFKYFGLVYNIFTVFTRTVARYMNSQGCGRQIRGGASEGRWSSSPESSSRFQRIRLVVSSPLSLTTYEAGEMSKGVVSSNIAREMRCRHARPLDGFFHCSCVARLLSFKIIVNFSLFFFVL